MFGLGEGYCYTCGMEVSGNQYTRFGKPFCSEEHAQQCEREMKRTMQFTLSRRLSPRQPARGSRAKLPFPREGGILTLWFSGLALGLSFLVVRGTLLAGLLYLAGALLLLASISTVEEFIRGWRGRKEVHLRLLIPPLLGFVSWLLPLTPSAVAVLILFVAALSFVSLRMIQRREREWQTRLGFTAAVLFMALLGLFLSGTRLGLPLVAIIFLVPFTFFSAQEMFVQHIAEGRRLPSGNPGPPGFREAVRFRKFILFAFLCAYAASSAATIPFASSAAFPLAFELFLAGFPAVWISSRKASFKKLGVEQASLDALVVVAVAAFATLSR